MWEKNETLIFKIFLRIFDKIFIQKIFIKNYNIINLTKNNNILLKIIKSKKIKYEINITNCLVI